jgi:replication factor C small subunit
MNLQKKFYDDHVWSLKYRPQTVEGLVIPKTVKDQFNNIIKEGRIPNLLFYGNAGVGKTSSAILLAELTNSEVMYINCSLNTSIDIVRNDVTKFVSSITFDGNRKLIIWDEADRLSPQASDSIKVFLEEFSSSCSFIFISNHINKIIPPLVSRLESIEFSFSKEEQVEMKKQFAKILLDILEKEGYSGKYDKKVLGHIIKSSYPDFRKILNQTQLIAKQGRLNDLSVINESSCDMGEYYNMIKEKDFSGIVNFVAGVSDYGSFFSKVYDTCKDYISPKSLPELVLLNCKYADIATRAIDNRITLAAFSIELMKEIEVL